MSDAKTRSVLLAFAAVLVVFASYTFLTADIADPPVLCGQDKLSEPDIVHGLQLDTVESVRPNVMSVADIDLESYGLNPEILSNFFVEKIAEHIVILDDARAFFTFAVTDNVGGHFQSRSHGRANRLVSLIICDDRNSETRLCKNMSVPFYGADRNPLCDVDQEVRIFFACNAEEE